MKKHRGWVILRRIFSLLFSKKSHRGITPIEVLRKVEKHLSEGLSRSPIFEGWVTANELELVVRVLLTYSQDYQNMESGEVNQLELTFRVCGQTGVINMFCPREKKVRPVCLNLIPSQLQHILSSLLPHCYQEGV